MFKAYINENSIMFLLLLFFAFVGWFYVQFQNTYIVEQSIPLKVKNQPVNKVPITAIPSHIDIQLEGKGAELFAQLIGVRNEELTLDFKQFEEQSIVTSSCLNTNKKFKHLKVKSISPDTLFVQMDEGIRKKVPIHFKSELSFQDGFTMINTIQFMPDSVIVSGPKSLVDTLTKWQTNALILDMLNANQSGKINLKTPTNSMHLSETLIAYNFEVEQVTEISFPMVDIGFLNKNNEDKFTLIPSSVGISFNVPLSKVKDVLASDFILSADLTEGSFTDNQGKVPMQVIEKPAFASSVRITPRIVEFSPKKVPLLDTENKDKTEKTSQND